MRAARIRLSLHARAHHWADILVRFRHFRVYAEEGLSREHTAIWLYGENLAVEYADDTLATYKVTYQPDKKRLLNVGEPRLFDTPHRSPQPHLWELGEAEWLKVVRVPEYARRRKRQVSGIQVPLP